MFKIFKSFIYNWGQLKHLPYLFRVRKKSENSKDSKDKVSDNKKANHKVVIINMQK